MLSDLQIDALQYFVESETVQEGCDCSGISRTCFYRWMQDPEFSRTLTTLKDTRVQIALNGLKGYAEKAVVTLQDIMTNSKKDSERRMAANDILDHMVKLGQYKDVADRLSLLENAAIKAGLIDKPAEFIYKDQTSSSSKSVKQQ